MQRRTLLKASLAVPFVHLAGRLPVVEAASVAPIALGVWVPGTPWDMSAFDQFAALTGKTPATALWYVDWTHPDFYTEGMEAIAARGAMPMVTWEPFDWRRGRAAAPAYAPRRIAAGDHDAYVRRFARGAARWGKPFYLRFAHEMNGDWYPWSPGVNGNTSAEFVAAWRHLHAIFREEGATNALWVWSPNYHYPGLTPLRDLYPGDAYVDWVALDGYNRGTNLPGEGWTSMLTLFARSYRMVEEITARPLMIAETGSSEFGGDKGEWIRSAFLAEIPLHMPRVRAVNWFHENKEHEQEADWRVTTSSGSLDAYRQVARSALYAGMLPGAPTAVGQPPRPAPPTPAGGISPAPAPPRR